MHWGTILTFSQHTAATVALGISLLVRRSLAAAVDVIFAGDEDRLVVTDVAVKSFKFRLVAVYALNIFSSVGAVPRRFEAASLNG